MSPSDRAWLHAPGSEQTLRASEQRFTNHNDGIPAKAAIYTLPSGVHTAPRRIGLQRY